MLNLHTKIRAIDQLSVFTFLWACQALIQQETFAVWITEGVLVGWILTFVLILTFLRANSVALLALGAFTNVWYSLVQLPYRVNHLFFEDVVNLTILAALAHTVFAKRNEDVNQRSLWRFGVYTPKERETFYHSFAKIVRVEVILLYLLAAVAKFNHDYLDPEVSCGAVMFRDLFGGSQSTAFGLAGSYFSIAFSLLGEVALPFLLLFRRTRVVGIVLALVFHIALGLHPQRGVYGFSAMMFALLFLFMGEGVVHGLKDTLYIWADRLKLPSRIKWYALIAAVIVAGFGLLVTFLYRTYGGDLYRELRIGFYVWGWWAAVVAFLYVSALARSPVNQASELRSGLAPSGFLWLFPAVVLLNGVSPYIGLKTGSSFTMFSNLRTENHSQNHLFLSGLPTVANFQSDVVEILAADRPELQRYVGSEVLLPAFEVERITSEITGDFHFRHLRAGLERESSRHNGTLVNGVLDSGYSPLLGRLMLFRPFDKGPKMLCRH